MPIYQYQCTDCGHALEALQKMSDSRLVDCPKCNAPSLKKQLTAAAFKLKGTGWYETDFKNSGKKPEANTKNAEANNAEASNGEASSVTAPDSKSDKSSDSKSSATNDTKTSSDSAAASSAAD